MFRFKVNYQTTLDDQVRSAPMAVGNKALILATKAITYCSN